MEKSKACWSEEKVAKHHKIVSSLLIFSGIPALYLSFDDIIILGNSLSAFIFPYFYNYFCLFLSFFQIYTAICFFYKQNWAKNAIVLILIIRLLMGYYDMLEVISSILILPYLLYIIPNARIGNLFKKNNNDISV